MTLDRRRFLQVAAAGMAMPVMAPAAGQHPVLKIRLADHPVLATERGALRLHPEGAKSPVDILVLPEGGYAAVWPICTHNGCPVRPEGWELFCPCHGSIFARDGRVLSGPAYKPLTRLPLVEAPGGELHITLIDPIDP
ncbi:MAG: Rieske 2Fe-2S domain-containing protein [Gemmatimonadales bacterium]|nr:Rieske 2Fe-2S domain-containing protein [Gemmatimonadales bacterium]